MIINKQIAFYIIEFFLLAIKNMNRKKDNKVVPTLIQ